MKNNIQIETINKQIADLENQKKEIEYKLDNIKKLAPEKQLAELLHSKQCHWNHTDGCGWYYESWDKPGHSRTEYLNTANNILKEVDFNTAVKVINLI